MRCDVLIVGGGPAGLAAAIALRQKGIDVLVADALQPPIDKACGEGLMPDSLDVLSQLGVFIPDDAGARFDGIAFLSQNTRAAARFPRGQGIGLRRPQLHTLLLRRAAELGARCAWGVHAVFETEGRLPEGKLARVEVLLNGEPCHYGLLIGADGQQSRVRLKSGLDAGSSVMRRFGRRRHFRLARSADNSMVEVFWGVNGQAYVTPVGQDEIGIAAVSRSPHVGLDEILRELPELRMRLEGSVATSEASGSITTTRRLRHVTQGEAGRGGIALVGDASGSADAVTGEGLALSFREALLLADAVNAGSLAGYEAGHPAILRQPRAMARAMLAMDRFPWLRNRALNVLAADAKLFPRLLALHVGDESAVPFSRTDGLRIGWRLLHSLAQPI